MLTNRHAPTNLFRAEASDGYCPATLGPSRTMFIITRTTRERFWVVIPAPPSRSGWEFPNPVSAETCVVEKLGFRLQRRQKLAHPLQPAVEFPDRRRVGNANVIFCAEAFPRHRRYMRLAQKLSGYIRGRVHVLAAEER